MLVAALWRGLRRPALAAALSLPIRRNPAQGDQKDSAQADLSRAHVHSHQEMMLGPVMKAMMSLSSRAKRMTPSCAPSPRIPPVVFSFLCQRPESRSYLRNFSRAYLAAA